MIEGRAPDGDPRPYAVDISHLHADQRQLLLTVLRAGDVQFGITRDELLADEFWADEIAKALVWVSAPAYVGEPEFDDPEYRSTLPPLVKPSRPPLPDGRRPATRWRRLAAGLFDELLVGIPTGLAARAGAETWLVIAVHMGYFVVPSTLFGWSIGKLVAGTRVVVANSRRPPNLWRAAVRWVIPYSPVVVALTVGLPGDVTGLLVALVYLPIMLDLRGWHDRAAGTLVVSRVRGH